MFKLMKIPHHAVFSCALTKWKRTGVSIAFSFSYADQSMCCRLQIKFTIVLECIPVYGRRDVEYILDSLPSLCKQRDREPHTHSHPHHGPFKIINLTCMQVFGVWEEARVPGENPGKHRKKLEMLWSDRTKHTTTMLLCVFKGGVEYDLKVP